MAIKNQKKLGKGLSVLFENVEEVLEINSLPDGSNVSGKVERIDIEMIVPNALQPRKYFSEDRIEELANSIEEFGFISPIILNKSKDSEEKYTIIAGERRYRAALLLEMKAVPAIVKSITDKKVINAIALIENVQREALTPVEEARCIQELINEYECDHKFIADKIGKSRAYVTNSLRILSLPEEVLCYLEKNELSFAHARAIVNTDEPVAHAKHIVENKLSVRETERYVKNINSKSKRTEESHTTANDNIVPINKSLQNPNAGRDFSTFNNEKTTFRNIHSSADAYHNQPVRYTLLDQRLEEGNVEGIEQALQEEMGMNVKIVDNKHTAELVIQFENLEQLDFLIHKLSSSTSFE